MGGKLGNKNRKQKQHTKRRKKQKPHKSAHASGGGKKNDTQRNKNQERQARFASSFRSPSHTRNDHFNISLYMYVPCRQVPSQRTPRALLMALRTIPTSIIAKKKTFLRESFSCGPPQTPRTGRPPSRPSLRHRRPTTTRHPSAQRTGAAWRQGAGWRRGGRR